MVHRFACLIVLVLAIVASACAAHQPRTYVLPLAGPQFDYQSPSVPVVPSCWDPRVGTNRDGVQYREWFDNSGSNTPTLFKITDRA